MRALSIPLLRCALSASSVGPEPELVKLLPSDGNFFVGVRQCEIAEGVLVEQALAKATTESPTFALSLTKESILAIDSILVAARVDEENGGDDARSLLIARGVSSDWRTTFWSHGGGAEAYNGFQLPSSRVRTLRAVVRGAGLGCRDLRKSRRSSRRARPRQ